MRTRIYEYIIVEQTTVRQPMKAMQGKAWGRDPSESQGGSALIQSKGWCVIVCHSTYQHILGYTSI
jgi:hypothetical protein